MLSGRVRTCVPFYGSKHCLIQCTLHRSATKRKFNFPFVECTSSRSDLLESLYLRISLYSKRKCMDLFNLILFPITPKVNIIDRVKKKKKNGRQRKHEYAQNNVRSIYIHIYILILILLHTDTRTTSQER